MAARPAPAARPLWWIVVLLLALAQLQWAGYEWGTGNQSIQIPFLQKLINPDLYPRDAMVTDTLPLYPTWFFRSLARLAPLTGLSNLYWGLHLLTTVAVLGAVVDDKPMFVALVTQDLTSRGIHAGNLLKRVATVTGGNAGGRPDMSGGG